MICFYERTCRCRCCCWVASVVSDSVRPHRRQPTRLPRAWDSPGKNAGVGCHFLLQCVKVKSLSRVLLLATAWTVAQQAPPSMGFSRQEYWSGVPLPSPPYKLHISKQIWSSWGQWQLYSDPSPRIYSSNNLKQVEIKEDLNYLLYFLLCFGKLTCNDHCMYLYSFLSV